MRCVLLGGVESHGDSVGPTVFNGYGKIQVDDLHDRRSASIPGSRRRYHEQTALVTRHVPAGNYRGGELSVVERLAASAHGLFMLAPQR